MKLTMKNLGGGLLLMLLAGLVFTQSRCQHSAEIEPPLAEITLLPASESTPQAMPQASPPHQAMSATAASPCSSVLVYIKVVIDKKFNFLARAVGGKRDYTWKRVNYDAANAWWDNPLIVFADPLIPDADVIGRAAAAVITGQGASSNVTVQVMLIPNAEVSVRTDPPSDGIRGTITTSISAVAEYFDGTWTEMVRERDRPITFRFDTLDPDRCVEEIGQETRIVPAFAFERYTRDELKWEPRSEWPIRPVSGDWRVVIYGRDATLEITSYRYVVPPVAEALP